MNITVTGGAGYIGARLVPKLLADGHKVTVVDTQWFGKGHLPTDNENLRVIRGDVRDTGIEGDVVIWLSSVSNNEMYGVNYDLTHEVNTYLDIDPKAKFIYASSVAVLDPTSDYAKDKLACEAMLKDSGAIIVRAASVVGYSPNMRFDITLNKMTHDAYKTGVVTVNGGEQQRAHVHIDDLCDYYKLILEKGELGKTYDIWGIGMSIRGAAESLGWTFEAMKKPLRIEYKPRTDNRNYGFDLTGESMRSLAPQKVNRAVWDGVRDIVARFDQGMWKDTSDELLWRINRNI